MVESNSSAVDWPTLVFDPQFMATLDKLAARRFGAGGLAEEATTHVIEYLSDNDWGKCASFQGKSKPSTFLYTLANNAIEEFSRKRFGRPRPPVWLQDLGELWVKLWRSLCLERQLLPALVDRFSDNGFREPEQVTQAAKVIKARIPNCGQSSMDSLAVDDIDAVSDAAQSSTESTDNSDNDGVELEFENPFHAELIMMVKAVVDDDICCSRFADEELDKTDSVAGNLLNNLDNFRNSLSLSDEERVMLKMIYVEGLSKTATSKALGMQAHQAGRIVNDALERIGAGIRTCGIDLDELLELV